jgi:hypothetical protein
MALSKIETGSLDVGPISGRRNIAINGSMIVAQRSVGPVSVSDGSNEGYNSLDRWKINFGSGMGGAVDISQVNPPSGTDFSKALKVEVTTAHTPTGSQFFNPTYAIEGQDLIHLQYGTSNAKSLVISFYIYTNKPGTYGLALRSYDHGRVIGKTFTVDSANTWQRITVVFEGDTAQAIDNDNDQGLHIWLGFGVGPNRMNGSTTWTSYSQPVYPGSSTTNFFDTVGNILYLTGFQVEVDHSGTGQASPFEHRSYGEELALCQRYFQTVDITTSGGAHYLGPVMTRSANNNHASFNCPVTMRTQPTLSVTNNGSLRFSANGAYTDGSSNSTTIGGQTLSVHTQTSGHLMTFNFGTVSGVSQSANYAQGGLMLNNGMFNLDAEL